MPKTIRKLEVLAPLDRLKYLRELQEKADRKAREIRRATFPTPGALATALEPGTVQTPALDVIDDVLVKVQRRELRRVIITMPPQEGKSTRVTTVGPLYCLAYEPDERNAIVSFAQDLADTFGRAIRNHITDNSGDDGSMDLGLRIAADSGAARRWQIDGHAGGVRAVGIAGGLTGRPVDRLWIDDPIANMEQAQSSRYRDRVWNFWQSVGYTRLAPDATVVIVLTRWHENDLAGRLLAAEDGHLWHVVSIPAIAESPEDVLGREIGEAMVSARGDRDWAAIRTAVGEYVWAALYQQRPAPAEGGLFKRAGFKFWTHCEAPSLARPALLMDGREVYLETLYKFLTVDLAASTKTSADYTVAALWGITLDGDLVLLDGLRKKLAPSMHWDEIKALRAKWDAGPVHVEAAMNATTLVYEAGRDGVPIEELKPDKDKHTRALPAAARVDTGRMWVPSVVVAPWVTDWLDELAAFPNAAHDDVVDNFAYAARVAAAHWLPMEPASVTEARRLAPAEQFEDLMSKAW